LFFFFFGKSHKHKYKNIYSLNYNLWQKAQNHQQNQERLTSVEGKVVVQKNLTTNIVRDQRLTGVKEEAN
jgi:hypothetical protein